tara:strand:- start:117 stop:758 length:642 start_codon:yes stop_codon:yes gene_type:complete
MKILVACEFSGIVRDAFIAAGHDATSCDLVPSESPGPHYCGDVRDIIGDGFDMVVAFPPCQHLASSGARWFPAKRRDGRQASAIDFFLSLANAKIPRVAIENPVGIMSSHYRKPDQIIQPWQFGEPFQKTTCLWLRNLPKLQSTAIVDSGEFYVAPSGRRYPSWINDTTIDGKKAAWTDPELRRIRSRTFSGIASAMATQWTAPESFQPDFID